MYGVKYSPKKTRKVCQPKEGSCTEFTIKVNKAKNEKDCNREVWKLVILFTLRCL